MTHLYDKIDPGFPEDLEKSKIAVQKTAEFFSGRGFPVIIEPTFMRPDPSQRAGYSDSGDLRLLVTCESKHRPELTFHSKETFVYDTVIVDVCHAFDNKRPKPFYYVIWNADYTSFILIDVHKTKEHWVKTSRTPGRQGRQRSYYEVDKKYCIFRNI